jgi:3-deoxy-D-manno-octulosonic-acid transferase
VLSNVRILARSAEDARRFTAIGAAADRVRDAGNVKFDAAARGLAPRPSDETEALRIVAGSTHAPEERLLIEAAAALRTDFPRLELVLAPRRVRRARAILRRARAAGFRSALASQSDPAAPVRVLDSIGGLAAAYSGAAIAVVGGTFSRHGGHSPLEAAVRGCALVIGPRPGAFRGEADALGAADAAELVGQRRDLVPVLRKLLSDPVRRHALGRRARQYVESGRGAAARCADEIVEALRERGAISAPEAPAASPRSGSADRGR